MVDGIIYSLQRHGGITVYFNELRQHLEQRQIPNRTAIYAGAADHLPALKAATVVRQPRFGERYRTCKVLAGTSLFHSSYYRLPDCRVPTVTTVHDFTYERFQKGPRKWVHSNQKFASIRQAQAIICISENTRTDLQRFLPDVPTERIHVIPNGVGAAFFPLQRRTDADYQRPFVLFVGARGGYKNFALVVDTLSRLPDLGLVCVGGGPLTAEEKSQLTKRIPGRFEHRPGISEQALNQLYNDAFCLVYPSAYEGFGIPVVEAMRAGCPVVAFNGSSIPEVAGDAALLLDRVDTDALAVQLTRMEDTGLRETMRRKGIDRAQQFSWKRTFEQTLKVYELTLGKSLSTTM